MKRARFGDPAPNSPARFGVYVMAVYPGWLIPLILWSYCWPCSASSSRVCQPANAGSLVLCGCTDLPPSGCASVDERTTQIHRVLRSDA